MQRDGAAYFGRRQSEPEAMGIPFPHVSANVYWGLGTEDGSQDFIIHDPYIGARVKKKIKKNLLYVNSCFIHG